MLMDRRNFLRTATAAGLLPLMPALPATPAAAAVAAPLVNDFMYGLAVFNARLRGASSAENIRRDLGIAKDAAAGLHNRMLSDGFIGLPNAAGMSNTSEPFAQTIEQRRKTTQKLREAMRQKVDDLKEDLLTEDDIAAEDKVTTTDPATGPASPTEPA